MILDNSFPEYERALFVLKQEIGLLAKITAAQDVVRNAVINRDWADFDSLIAAMNDLSAEFAALETERTRLFVKFSEAGKDIDEQTGFYTLISRLPENKRQELTNLYRGFKLESIKTRIANDTLLRCLNEAKTVINAFLEAAFPDRKGQVYSRQGVRIPQDMRSMVLNSRF
jgi:hypothetical protein